MMRQHSLIEVREDVETQDEASCSFAAMLELATLGDFVTCRDAEAPLTVMRPREIINEMMPKKMLVNEIPKETPKEVPKEMLLALEELYTCGEFFACQDPDMAKLAQTAAKQKKDSRSPKREQLPDPPAADDLYGNIYTKESPGGSCSNVPTGGLCAVTAPSPSSAQYEEAVFAQQYDDDIVVVYDEDSNTPEENEPLIMIVDEDDSRASVRAVRDDSSSISYRRSPMHLSYASPTHLRGVERRAVQQVTPAALTVVTAVRDESLSNNNNSNYAKQHRYDVQDTDTVRAVAPRRNFDSDDSASNDNNNNNNNNSSSLSSMSAANKVIIVVVRRPQYTSTLAGHAE